MDQSVRVGRAFRHGQLIADEVQLIEQAELRASELPVAGSDKSILRQRMISGPTMIRFTSIVDQSFRADLQRLADARRDPEVGRRDRGWTPEAIDLVMNDRMSFTGVQLQRPFDGFGATETIAFNAAIPER